MSLMIKIGQKGKGRSKNKKRESTERERKNDDILWVFFVEKKGKVIIVVHTKNKRTVNFILLFLSLSKKTNKKNNDKRFF